jgi:predicted transcriptional regulator
MNQETGEIDLDARDVMRMTTDIVASFVNNNTIPVDSVPELIRSIHRTIRELADNVDIKPVEKQKPAVSISKSVQDDYIVCLEDGKRLKMLKRYLKSRYDMEPDDYRRKWGLASDYPMVAPNYSARRSEFARQIGLGTASGGRPRGRPRKNKS